MRKYGAPSRVTACASLWQNALTIEINNILPIKIVNNGNSFIIRTIADIETSQPTMEPKRSSNFLYTQKKLIRFDNRNSSIKSEMETDSETKENWMSTKIQKSKKRKINEPKNNNNNSFVPFPIKWLQDIHLINSYNLLDDSTRPQNTTGKLEKEKAVKPPPICFDAKIIDPLLELLDETAGQKNYLIKQLKGNQVKVQTTTPETFRKVINALKIKDAGYHTY